MKKKTTQATGGPSADNQTSKFLTPAGAAFGAGLAGAGNFAYKVCKGTYGTVKSLVLLLHAFGI